jgi:hypothetical protein
MSSWGWQSALVAILIASFAGWLIACAIASLYRGWRRKQRVIRQRPWKDPRAAQHRNFERDWK